MSPRPTDTRVFLAVLPDPALRSALSALRARLLPRQAPGWRTVRAEDLHLTLRFFGNLPPAGADPAIDWRARLVSACDRLAAAQAPVATRCEGITLWQARGPRPLVVGIVPTGGLRRLAQAAEALAIDLGFPAEKRAWRPHITLARATATAAPLRSGTIDWSALPPLSIGSLSLLHSRAQPAARRYETIWQRRLAGSGPGPAWNPESAKLPKYR